MQMLLRMIALSAVLALLAACSPAAPPEPTTAPAEPAAPSAAPDEYPAPTPNDSPYPAPTSTSPYPSPEGGTESASPVADTGPLVVPQPSSASVGNVTGVLLRINSDGTQTPMANSILYLADLLVSDNGEPAMVGVDRNTAPSAITNSRGEFVFTDIEPGTYGLMFDSITAILLLSDPADGGNMLIDVTGGEIRDMGELAYPLPEL